MFTRYKVEMLLTNRAHSCSMLPQWSSDEGTLHSFSSSMCQLIACLFKRSQPVGLLLGTRTLTFEAFTRSRNRDFKFVSLGLPTQFLLHLGWQGINRTRFHGSQVHSSM